MDLLPYDEDAFEALTDELDRSKTSLDYRGPLPRVWAGRLRRELEAEAIAASTSMEGVPVTVEEVRRILAGQPAPEVSPEDRELVEGYRDAMSFVLRRADDPSFAWSTELFVGLHDRILAGRHSLGAGRFRSSMAYVVNSLTGLQVFLPPPPEEVSDLVADACVRMEQGHPHAAVSSAWIHVAMAAIHPFRDGNGRAARVVASLAMYRGGFKRPEFTSLEEWWGRHLAEYYSGFECLGSEFEREADVTPFIRAHIEAQLHQVRALDQRERVERQVWLALEEVVDDAHLPTRVVNALWDAFFGREVTAGFYRAVADISAATATNDLSAAGAAGLLRPVGERRGRKYYPGEELLPSVAAALFIEGDFADGDEARRRILQTVIDRLNESGQGREPR